jgi:hypothetical protein
MANKRIIIGGTGRSGTTILYRLLGSNPDVYAFSPEMRFIIDASGLLPLIDSLSTSYTLERSREQIYRFVRLMRYDMMSPTKSPYKGYYFKNFFGEQYDAIVNRFIDKITMTKYQGEVLQNNYEEMYYWTGGYSKLRKNKTFEKEYSDPHTYLGKYFKDRAELEQIAKEFVDELFSIPMNAEGKKTWCEKSPGNLFNFKEIHRLFPDAVYVHVKRDPRGVCQSYMKQKWAPSEVEGSAHMVGQLYSRWSVLKNELPSDMNYLEVKLEDLVEDPMAILTKISKMADISESYPAADTLDKHKANYWKDELSPQELETMNRLLGDVIPDMGYSL